MNFNFSTIMIPDLTLLTDPKSQNKTRKVKLMRVYQGFLKTFLRKISDSVFMLRMNLYVINEVARSTVAPPFERASVSMLSRDHGATKG